MNAVELVQLAVFVSLHSRVLTRSRLQFPDLALERYWTASKCRQERWSRALKVFSGECEVAIPSSNPSHAEWCEGVLTEILVSEVLSRVWAGVCQASDRIRKSEDAGPLANSVLAGHLDARHRVLNLLVYSQGIGVAEAVRLNRRRLESERCADMLLACLEPRDASKFAFEPGRVHQWTRSFRQNAGGGMPSRAALYNLSICQWSEYLDPVSENGDLNREIGNSILGCLPAAVFDYLGSIMGPLHLSLLQGVPDSEGHLQVESPNRQWNGGGTNQSWFDDRRRNV